MIYFLLFAVAIVLLGFFLIERSRSCSPGEPLGAIFIFAGFVMLLVGGVSSPFYYGAKYKAEIINREYGTNYTQAEVFYAGSVINTIRELQRKRIELNGDLLQDK